MITLLIDDAAKAGYGEYRTHLGISFDDMSNERLDGPNYGNVQLE
jgi:hypothetical protein